MPQGGLAIPAPAAALTVTQIGADASGTTGTGAQTATLATGAAAAHKDIVLVAAYGTSDAEDPQIDVTFDGQAPGARLGRVSSQSGVTVEIYRHDAAAGGDVALSVLPAGAASFRGFSWHAYLVEKGSEPALYDFVSASAGDPGLLDLSAAVEADDRIVGAVNLRNKKTSGAWALTGLTGVQSYTTQSPKLVDHFEATAGTTELRAMTAEVTGDGSGEIAGALVVIG